MTTTGAPAVFVGSIFDSIIDAAGGVNSFKGTSVEAAAQINVEALAAAKVDVLVIGLFQANEKADVYAKDLFSKYPDWAASKTKSYTTVSDSFYLGPLNAIAIEKIASAIALVR